MQYEGILPVNKPAGITSFQIVRILRKLLGVKKIGHAGTLDPFATGVMIMLIGRKYTQLSDSFLNQDKEYLARLYLGSTTDTYDCDGEVQTNSPYVPTLQEVEASLEKFQGEIEQIPPMFSAKKINGQKLYDLARKGQSVERKPVKIRVNIELISYNYPTVDLRVQCSKGTYIRSLAHDIGQLMTCGAHLVSLIRTKSGRFKLADCVEDLADGLTLKTISEKLQFQG